MQQSCSPGIILGHLRNLYTNQQAKQLVVGGVFVQAGPSSKISIIYSLRTIPLPAKQTITGSVNMSQWGNTVRKGDWPITKGPEDARSTFSSGRGTQKARHPPTWDSSEEVKYSGMFVTISSPASTRKVPNPRHTKCGNVICPRVYIAIPSLPEDLSHFALYPIIRQHLPIYIHI